MDSYLQTFRKISIIAVGASLTYLAITIVVWRNGESQSFAEIGDAHGFLNALFSGLALAGVVVALMMQTEELRIAREERQESLQTQKELSEQSRFSALAVAIDTWSKLADQKPLKLESSPAEFELAIHKFHCRKKLEAELDIAAFDTNNQEFSDDEIAEEALMLQRLHTFVRAFELSHRRRVYPRARLNAGMLQQICGDLEFHLQMLNGEMDSDIIDQCDEAIVEFTAMATRLERDASQESAFIERFAKLTSNIEMEVYERICFRIGHDTDVHLYK